MDLYVPPGMTGGTLCLLGCPSIRPSHFTDTPLRASPANAFSTTKKAVFNKYHVCIAMPT